MHSRVLFGCLPAAHPVIPRKAAALQALGLFRGISPGA